MIHFGTYELTYLRTYIHTYEHTYVRTNKSLLKKSSYTKTSLTKKVPNDTSTCSKFFFRGRNPKIDRDRLKKPSFLTENCGYLISFFLKILQVNPTWKFPNFSQYFSWTFLEFFLFQKFHLEPLFNPFLKKVSKKSSSRKLILH